MPSAHKQSSQAPLGDAHKASAGQAALCWIPIKVRVGHTCTAPISQLTQLHVHFPEEAYQQITPLILSQSLQSSALKPASAATCLAADGIGSFSQHVSMPSPTFTIAPGGSEAASSEPHRSRHQLS